MTQVISIEGNGTRPSHFGCGFSDSGTMYTLNYTEIHCVCYEICSFDSNAMGSGKGRIN